MVALLPAAGALRDAFLAAGLGFLLGLCYRAARFAAGDSRAACCVCDVLICVVGAVVYRSAAVGSFAAGVMRWYTVACTIAGYALCQKIFFKIFARCASTLHFLLLWPFRMVHHYILCPVGAHVRAAGKKMCAVRAAKRAATQKKRKIGLPKGQHMLYNSQ